MLCSNHYDHDSSTTSTRDITHMSHIQGSISLPSRFTHCLRYVGITFLSRIKEKLEKATMAVWVILQDMSSNFD
ncbi:hypothetical protein Bca4012_083602 [Brassica carinata]